MNRCFEQRSASARGQFLRAAFEDMVGGTTKHTTDETHRVTLWKLVSGSVGKLGEGVGAAGW